MISRNSLLHFLPNIFFVQLWFPWCRIEAIDPVATTVERLAVLGAFDFFLPPIKAIINGELIAR
jgi:hypothetical protein